MRGALASEDLECVELLYGNAASREEMGDVGKGLCKVSLNHG